MSVQFYPLEACEANAIDMQTALVNSVVHLFQDTLPAPDPSTPLTAYTDAEADFSGYADQTIVAWLDPILAEGTGYMINSPNLQWVFDDSPGTPTNLVSGFYLLDSGGTIRFTVIFTNPVPMQVHGQGILFSIVLFFPTGV